MREGPSPVIVKEKGLTLLRVVGCGTHKTVFYLAFTQRPEAALKEGLRCRPELKNYPPGYRGQGLMPDARRLGSVYRLVPRQIRMGECPI